MPPALVVGSGALNSVDLKQKIITNVEQVIGRINGIAPQYIIAEEVCLHFTYSFMIFLLQMQSG